MWLRRRNKPVKAVRQQTPPGPGEICAMAALLVGTVVSVRQVYLSLSGGGNDLANDYVDYVPVVDRILSTISSALANGSISAHQLSDLIGSTFIGTRPMFASFLVFVSDAHFFAWQALSDMFVAQALVLFSTFFLFDCLSAPQDDWKRSVLLGILLTLNFGTAQACVLQYGALGVPLELSVFGFCLALWSQHKYAGDWRGVVGTIAGAYLSVFAWGNVAPCWAALLLGAAIHPGRKIAPNAVLVAAMVTSLLPFILAHPQASGTALIATLNGLTVLQTLGLPFHPALGITADPTVWTVGDSGGLLLLIMIPALVYAFVKVKRFPATARTSAIVATYGLTSVLSIMTGSSSSLLPSYVPFATMMWCAVVGGIYTFIVHVKEGSANFRRSIVALCVSGLVALYLVTNVSFENKNPFAQVRIDASQSSLLNFASAPTYAQSCLFLADRYDESRLKTLAMPLQRQSWSSFANRRQQVLQGDYLLDSVESAPGVDGKQAFWSTTSSFSGKSNWSKPDHLNLVLPDGARVTWSIELPLNARGALFVSAYGAGQTDQGNTTPGNALIVISDGQAYEHQIYRLTDTFKNVSLPITRYVGKKVTITLQCLTSKPGQPALAAFQHPHIALDLQPIPNQGPQDPAKQKLLPSNTDLSPSFVSNQKDDQVILSVSSSTPEPVASFQKDVNIAAADYSHLVLGVKSATEINSSSPISPTSASNPSSGLYPSTGSSVPAISVEVQTDKGEQCSRTIPLLPGAQHHRYSYPLRLMELADGCKITHLSVQPLASAQPGSQALFDEVRLVHRVADAKTP